MYERLLAWLLTTRAWFGARKERRRWRQLEIVRYTGCDCGRFVRGSIYARRRRSFERCVNCKKEISTHGRWGRGVADRGALDSRRQPAKG